MTERESYKLVVWVFLRILGVVYFFAFLSLLPQISGLFGSQGILPVEGFLSSVRSSFGIERFLYFPTIFWYFAADAFLQAIGVLGIILSILLIAGLSSALILLLLWGFYLSFVTAGQAFMSFQWDTLLLEVGFLAIFLAPWAIPRPHLYQPPKLLIFLFRLLLFKLVFSSGAIKLLSGDESWRNLTALTYHYFTQPLPNPISWYFSQLPVFVHKLSALGMFFIELIIPFFIFAPWRRIRFVAAFLIVLLQAFIGITGNYTFFNLLTASLALFILDDAVLLRIIPKPVVSRLAESVAAAPNSYKQRKFFIPALAAVLISLTVLNIGRLFIRERTPLSLDVFVSKLSSFHINNSYGLFAVMTTARPEIVIEGGMNGDDWQEYEFKYKPGDLRKSPPFVAPHQPRLDWQMWFAALGGQRERVWFTNLMLRLLQGSPPVLALLGENPAFATPPKYVRAQLYEYRFTDFSNNRENGKWIWWTREYKGLFFPEASISAQSR